MAWILQCVHTWYIVFDTSNIGGDGGSLGPPEPCGNPPRDLLDARKMGTSLGCILVYFRGDRQINQEDRNL